MMTRRTLLLNGLMTVAVGAQAARGNAATMTQAATPNPNDAHPETKTSPHLRYWYPLPAPEKVLEIKADVCIYGATPGGIAAAIQAQRMGKSTLLLAFDGHLGGMTSGGLGATDIGNKAAIGGISREFYRRLGKRYGKDEAWTFEPTVAEETLHAFCQEHKIQWLPFQRLVRVRKDGNRITAIETEGGHTFRASYFVDASYEGDLLARAGVSNTVGREPNARYGETLNGVHFGHPNHNFKVPVDPFVTPGNPASGLLRGIVQDEGSVQGDGDKHVQAYNFRLCMTHAPDRLPFPRPAGYDPARYELFARYIAAQNGQTDALRLSTTMPGGKTDTNNFGGFSSDNIGMSDGWAEADYQKREKLFQDHVTYQQGMMWFLCHDERVPAPLRETVKGWGLPHDEFTATGGWPHQLYVREARRLVGDLVMTEHHCTHAEKVKDSIGLAAYRMDSHNCRRVARQEKGVWTARNEGNVEVAPTAPYGISYRALTPRETECANLLVPVCLSASHIAYGSIRMEPVFFVLGQSAATAACLALDAGNVPVQRINIAALQARLKQDGQVLDWDAATMPATTEHG